VVARLITERMSEDLGQQVFIENRPGAGTMIGASAVARSRPTLHDADGRYGDLRAQSNALRQAADLRSGEGLYPVCRTGRVPLILVANPKTVSANTVKELIELARRSRVR